MKNKVSVLIMPLLLWACSVDPHQGVSGQDPQSLEAADSSGNPGAVDSVDSEEKVASGGSVVDMPVEVVNPGPAEGSKPEEPKPQLPPVAQVPEAPKAPVENENTVTPPNKITGAFLMGEVIPNEDGDTQTIKIGIIAKQDDIRLSQEPERFELNWRLAAESSLESSLRLLPSKNAAYDRILEFDGTMAELEGLENQISIQLSVSEGGGGAKLENLVKSTVSDLFKPQVVDSSELNITFK